MRSPNRSAAVSAEGPRATPARQPGDTLCRGDANMSTDSPHQPETSFNHRYLRVADLRNLRNMVFSPRRRIEGQYAGRHATPQRGHAIEFADYREYVPGDAVTDIDWKVYGRSDRLYIKQFEHQADMTVNLLLDASASMHYAGADGKRKFGASWLGGVGPAGRKIKRTTPDGVITNPSKYDQACLMAAAIAFLTVKQQDRVALGVACNGLDTFIPPGGSFRHLHTVLGAMERDPRAKAGLAAAITEAARRTDRRGLFLIFSDLMEDQDDLARALSLLTHRGMEAIVFHVLHRDEIRLPDLPESVFVDSETGQRVRLNTHDVRARYDEAFQRRMASWCRLFRGRGIGHHVVTTDTHYSKALEGYLFSRAAMV